MSTKTKSKKKSTKVQAKSKLTAQQKLAETTSPVVESTSPVQPTLNAFDKMIASSQRGTKLLVTKGFIYDFKTESIKITKKTPSEIFCKAVHEGKKNLVYVTIKGKKRLIKIDEEQFNEHFKIA